MKVGDKAIYIKNPYSEEILSGQVGEIVSDDGDSFYGVHFSERVMAALNVKGWIISTRAGKACVYIVKDFLTNASEHELDSI